MNLKNIVKKSYAIALVAILLLPGLSLIRSYAANGIDPSKTCTLTISVEGSEYEEGFKEIEIPVSLYKVADMDANGKFTAVGAFSKIDFNKLDEESTADVWMTLAEQAMGYTANADVAAQTVVKTEDGTDTAKAVVSDLEVGLYLVVPQETYNLQYSYKYTFIPYLTALPSYAKDSDGATAGWNYEPVIGLKAGMEEQYGDLSITKKLSNYNVSLGPVTFVFEVEAVSPEGDVVYSNVVSTTHSEAGSETVKIEHLPATATVTVTEVYSGASYTATSEEIVNGIIIYSEKAVEEGATEASATFTNAYDGGTKGGYGVLNRFESDGNGGWIWENPTKNEE